MDEQTKNNLLAKREEVQQKLRQAEADIYFFQGYLQCLADLEKEADHESEDV